MTRTSDESEFPVSETARIAGANPRTIQFWAMNGALIPSEGTAHTGRGRHRHFSRDEVMIACVLQALATRGIPIAELKRIADAVRVRALREIKLHQGLAVDVYAQVNWWHEKAHPRTAINFYVTKEGKEPLFIFGNDLKKKNALSVMFLLNAYLSRLPPG